MDNDSLFDGSRVLTLQYAKRVREVQEAVNSNAYFTRIIPSAATFKLLVSTREAHPFTDTHPLANLGAIAPYALQLESPLAEMVAAVKAARCWYDWIRFERDGEFADHRETLHLGVDSWLDGRLELGRNFESSGFRIGTAQRKWQELGFPLNLVEQEALGSAFDDLLLQAQRQTAKAFTALSDRGRQMADSVTRQAAGQQFDEFMERAFSVSQAVAAGATLRVTRPSEYFWITREAKIGLASDVPQYYAAMSFSVADIFWRRMMRREPPTGAGRSGICAYLAMVGVEADHSSLPQIFGADMASVANAESLVRIYRRRAAQLLQDLGSSTIASVYRTHDITPEALF